MYMYYMYCMYITCTCILHVLCTCITCIACILHVHVYCMYYVHVACVCCSYNFMFVILLSDAISCFVIQKVQECCH